MNNKKNRALKSSSGGFTLAETALAVVIGSALLISATSLVKIWTNQTAQMKSRQRLKVIQQAIIDYKAQHNRLPCPASFTGAGGFGRESSTSCTIAGPLTPGTFSKSGRFGSTSMYSTTPKTTGTIIFGALPVHDLGLPDSYAANTHGYMYTYAMTKSEWTAPLNGFAGAINIVDATAKSVVPPAADGSFGTAIYAVIDHGKDGKGAYYNGNATAPTNCTGGLDQLNCSFEPTASPGAANPFSFLSIPFNSRPGALYFDDIVVYGTSLAAKTNACQTVYNAPNTAVGTSNGHFQKGLDYGWGTTWGFIGPYIGFFSTGFFYSDTPSTSGMNADSPRVIASCTGGHVVGGGCTQTKGAPLLDASGTHFTNIYTGDFVFMGPPSSLTQQLIQPPLSHPFYTTTGAQGWECDGSSANGIYTQAYAICCTGQ